MAVLAGRAVEGENVFAQPQWLTYLLLHSLIAGHIPHEFGQLPLLR